MPCGPSHNGHYVETFDAASSDVCREGRSARMTRLVSRGSHWGGSVRP